MSSTGTDKDASDEQVSEENELRSLDSCEEISLEHVAGVTNVSKNGISSSPCNGNVAFSVSSVLVLLDPRCSDQAFFENPSSRGITAITYSEDGRYIAHGEQGVNPHISVYNAKQYNLVNRFQVAEKCSVKSLLFHTKSLYLIVLPGNEFSILIYEFQHGEKIATAKWVVEPLAMTMTKIDNVLVVCGHRKIMCFSTANINVNNLDMNSMMDKRAILLGKQGNYTFVDITSGHDEHAGHIYTVTSCGYLCQIQCGDILINQVLKISERIFCVKFQLGRVFVGCTKGYVKVCNPADLTVIASVCDTQMSGPDELQLFSWSYKESDVVGLTVNPTTSIVTTILSNQRRHSWHFKETKETVDFAPVVVVNSKNNAKQMPNMLTIHDMQCTLAQMLLRSESKNASGKDSTSGPQRRYIDAIKITPDDKSVIYGNQRGEVEVYDALTGILRKVIEIHSSAITYIELMYDEEFKLLASGGRDRTIVILNVGKDYEFVQTFSEHSSAIVSISMVHNNGILTLMSSSSDGSILIRRAPKEEKLNFVLVGELPECMGSRRRVYNHCNGYIITGQERGRINLFAADPCTQLKPSRKIQIGEKLLKTVTIDPTGTFFVAYSSAGQYLFHLQTGQQIATLCAVPGFSFISFSTDLKYLINSNDSGSRFLWRLPNKIVDIMKNKIYQDNQFRQPHALREFSFTSYKCCVRVWQKLMEEGRGPSREDVNTERIKSPRVVSKKPSALSCSSMKGQANVHARNSSSQANSESSTACCSPFSHSFSEAASVNRSYLKHLTSPPDLKGKAESRDVSVDGSDVSSDLTFGRLPDSKPENDVDDLPDLSDDQEVSNQNVSIRGNESTIKGVNNKVTGFQNSETSPKRKMKGTETVVRSKHHSHLKRKRSGHSGFTQSSSSQALNEKRPSFLPKPPHSCPPSSLSVKKPYSPMLTYGSRGVSEISGVTSNRAKDKVVSDADKRDSLRAISLAKKSSTVNLSCPELPTVKKLTNIKKLKGSMSLKEAQGINDGYLCGSKSSTYMENTQEMESTSTATSTQITYNIRKGETAKGTPVLETADEQLDDNCFDTKFENNSSINSPESRSDTLLMEVNTQANHFPHTEEVDNKDIFHDISYLYRAIHLSNSQETYSCMKDEPEANMEALPSWWKDDGMSSDTEFSTDTEDKISRSVDMMEDRFKRGHDSATSASRKPNSHMDKEARDQFFKDMLLRRMFRRMKKEKAIKYRQKETHRQKGGVCRSSQSPDLGRNDSPLHKNTMNTRDSSTQSVNPMPLSASKHFKIAHTQTKQPGLHRVSLDNDGSEHSETRILTSPSPTYRIPKGTSKVASTEESSLNTNTTSITSATSKPPSDRIGGMADMFRNQDEYLRKLKEVRRNFELSIQALSNERKNQMIEASKPHANQ